MLTAINPKLPMRNNAITKDFYISQLGFKHVGMADYESYLLIKNTIPKFIFLNLNNLTQKKIMDKCILEQMIYTNFTNHLLTIK